MPRVAAVLENRLQFRHMPATLGGIGMSTGRRPSIKISSAGCMDAGDAKYRSIAAHDSEHSISRNKKCIETIRRLTGRPHMLGCDSLVGAVLHLFDG